MACRVASGSHRLGFPEEGRRVSRPVQAERRMDPREAVAAVDKGHSATAALAATVRRRWAVLERLATTTRVQVPAVAEAELPRPTLEAWAGQAVLGF